MKLRMLYVAIVLALVLSLIGQPAQVKAAGYGTKFITSITFQNVGTGPATVSVEFYPANSSTPVLFTIVDPVPQNAAKSLHVGSVSGLTTSAFTGSAVMSSDQPLVATLVQLPQAPSTVRNRPLSNGFSSGSDYVLIPTVLKNTFATHSVFSVQNIDSVGADLTVRFVPVAGTIITKTLTNLPVGSAQYYDLATMAELGASFNGSVQILAKKTGTQNPGAVVATSMELLLNTDGVYAFEGTPNSANKIYMPSAICNAFGGQNTFYAVQNVGTTDAVVNVRYSSGKVDGPITIGGGKKESFPGCGKVTGLNAAGFSGSATIESVGAAIVAVGKKSGAGLSTAFLGVPSGASKLALPYVRWTTAQWTTGARQRSFIAVQNVGAADIAADQVTVKYYDNNGGLVGTHALGALVVGAKLNSNASILGAAGNEFGYFGSAIGGGVIVEGPAGSQLAVVVTVSSIGVGEDYNGTPLVVP